MNNYPYTNTHDLNLDWILKQVKGIDDKYKDLDSTIAAGVEAVQHQEAVSLQDLNNQKLTIVAAINGARDIAIGDVNASKTNALEAIAALGNTWDSHYESLIAEMPADLASITQTLAILGRILTGNSVQAVTFFMGDYDGGSKTNPVPTSTSDVSTDMIIGGAGLKFVFTLDNAVDADTKIYGIRWFEGKNADTGVYMNEHVVNCGNVRTYTWTVPDTCYGFSITLRNNITWFTAAPASNIATLRWFTTISDFVSVDGDQYFTDTQKAQGRENIGAAAVSAIKDSPNYNLRIGMDAHSDLFKGIQYTWNGDVCTITGTAIAVSYNDLFISQNSLPDGIRPGDVLRIEYASEKVWFVIYDYSGGAITNISEVKQNTIVKIPDTCTGLIIRLWVANGTTVNESVCPKIFINGDYIIKAVDVATPDETGKTNMRPIIQKMLDLYGYCKLDVGAFYIDDMITLKEGDVLEGCGEVSEIRLMSGNNKAAIKMWKYSTVKNLSVIGAYNDLTESDFTSANGSRYGIQYYKGSIETYETAYCSITNVLIKNFSGGGIYQYGTGANVEQGLFVSNVRIKNCWCGIWIYANSEFSRYSNVQITYCYIACINNGGNNAFDNCVLHAYSVGMKIDGTQNNAAHGMCANTSFCHIGNNAGSALTIDQVEYGFVFSSCQFWYNTIDLTDSSGIVFNGCEFGRGSVGTGAKINITGGNTVMFGNCVFMNDISYPPVITVTNNNKVKISDCYGSVSGNAIVLN